MPTATKATSSATTGGTGRPTIEVRDLTCHFSTKRAETTALDNVSISIEQGEFVTIVGPSGCGKSTLLKIIAGLIRPTAGTVHLLGEPVTRPQRDVGFAFQRSALLEWRGARKNILLQAEMRGMDKAQAERRADYLIEMTGLKGFENALPHELSGGMQQRVALCRALLHEPPVLLMDEPFGALDALTRETMNVEMNRIWRETGVTVVLVTHSIAEAIYLGNRIEVMSPRPGRIVRTMQVELPAERNYGDTLATQQFKELAAEIRDLLGASGAHE